MSGLKWFAGAMAASLALFGGTATAQQADAADWTGARPSVHFELEPGADTGSWVAIATVSDLRNGKVLANPSLTLAAGTPAVIELGTPGAVTLHLEVAIDATATRAMWTFELRDGDEPLTRQHAVLTLSRPREAAY